MATYLEMLAKLQAQTLDGLKQIQAVQVNALTTAREMVASMPTTPTMPTMEGMPTLAQIADLNTSFATQLLDQQKAFAGQLAELFTPAVKASTN